MTHTILYIISLVCFFYGSILEETMSQDWIDSMSVAAFSMLAAIYWAVSDES